MYSNINAPPTLGANIPPNVAPTPFYSYGCRPYRNDFILIVVLFILLIIVGASCFNNSRC